MHKQARVSSSLYPGTWHRSGTQYKLVELMLMEREGMKWATTWQHQLFLDEIQCLKVTILAQGWRVRLAAPAAVVLLNEGHRITK